ncbi:MAG: UMP kinase [Candidatus Nanoarchaeia archaeon]|nr:UMP kinase [Candidatus Nanoarchaeia archaeon]MDD5741473.1 UMP kinase [Candidatus Nanoarchaeia archaeon]
MVKEVIIISLGGSLIIPDEINTNFLEKFKKTLFKYDKKYRFVVVCGGGKTARNYINGLSYVNKREFFQCLLGIASTRLNARFMTYFFGEDANEGIPHNMEEIKNLLRRNFVVFCGALRYAKHETSDGTAAKLARFFDCDFINLTNVQGLYDKDPKKNKKTKFIPEISHKDFYKMTKKIEFKPGQHFVLDQNAAKIIKKYKITTYILGHDLKNLDNVLNKKHFVGTRIS